MFIPYLFWAMLEICKANLTTMSSLLGFNQLKEKCKELDVDQCYTFSTSC